MIGELFDPKADVFIHERLRPHWSQAGAVVFITLRTNDSIPREVIARWDREKQSWVERVLTDSRGSLPDPTPPDTTEPPAQSIALACDAGTALDRGAIHDYQHWSRLIPLMTDRQRHEFNFHFNRCRETKLDECLGACVLKRPELAQIVSDSLLYFDGDRYRMGDFIVMPNHVHMLAAFPTADVMEKQFDSWMHYTARLINRELGTRGRFWQQEPFDHLVRSPEQYDYLRRYIRENPTKANLRSHEFLYREYSP